MNRYETVLRRNVAMNLVKLSSQGFPVAVNKSNLTNFEKRFTYKDSLKTKEIATLINRYSWEVMSDVRTPSFAGHMSADVLQKLLQQKEMQDQQQAIRGSRRRAEFSYNMISGNEITKAKNWKFEEPTESKIAPYKVALIRDWLTRIDFYVEYYAVALDEDERYYSVVDFLTQDRDSNRNLQEHMPSVSPPDGHVLKGDYHLFRRSLNHKDAYVKAAISFEKSPVGRHSYKTKAQLNRGDMSFEATADGFYFYTGNCFMLTGRYSVFIDGKTRTMIDHYVLHDDSNNAQLEGIWNTIYLGTNEPRAIAIALFRTQDHNELHDLPNTGAFSDLPSAVRARLKKAKAYFKK